MTTGVRVVIEVPAYLGRTERDAVSKIQNLLAHDVGRNRIKSYVRVRTAERLKTVGVNDTATRLRRLRDELSAIVQEIEP
jgi:hypothetical protein